MGSCFKYFHYRARERQKRSLFSHFPVVRNNLTKQVSHLSRYAMEEVLFKGRTKSQFRKKIQLRRKPQIDFFRLKKRLHVSFAEPTLSEMYLNEESFRVEL